MNPQELFIDVSSGRFLDGESTIAVAKPNFFSDEKKDIVLGVFKVKKNVLGAVTPSPKSSFQIRLGTPSLKLADGVDVSTAPPALIRATGTITTAGSTQAKGIGIVTTYSPVTATFIVSVVSAKQQTATITCNLGTVYSNTRPTITVAIGTYTIPSRTIMIARS